MGCGLDGTFGIGTKSKRDSQSAGQHSSPAQFEFGWIWLRPIHHVIQSSAVVVESVAAFARTRVDRTLACAVTRKCSVAVHENADSRRALVFTWLIVGRDPWLPVLAWLETKRLAGLCRLASPSRGLRLSGSRASPSLSTTALTSAGQRAFRIPISIPKRRPHHADFDANNTFCPENSLSAGVEMNCKEHKRPGPQSKAASAKTAWQTIAAQSAKQSNRADRGTTVFDYGFAVFDLAIQEVNLAN